MFDLADMWVHFDLREDLVKTLKLGDRFGVRIPALSDRRITVEVRLIANKSEYASWRATRATGDFDLRTFEIRAYPVETKRGGGSGIFLRLRCAAPLPLTIGRSARRTSRRRSVSSRCFQ
jgi:hypothetical protein